MSHRTSFADPAEYQGPQGYLQSKLASCNTILVREIARRRCRAPRGGVEASEGFLRRTGISCRVAMAITEVLVWQLADGDET